MDDMPAYMSLEQIAKLLGISERTVVRLIEEGKLVGFKVGRSWRFDQADIDAYVKRQKELAQQQLRSEDDEE
jgi:excisionase family DNA binding protein